MSFTELSSFLQAQPEPHLLFDNQYRIIAVNQAFHKYCHSQTSVIGRTCYEISHNYDMPCDRSGETCPLAKSRRSGKPERVLHMHHTPDGEEYVSIELTPIKNPAGDVTCFVEKIEPVKIAKGVLEKNSLKGESPAFRSMMNLVEKAASSDINVLLCGESGTGKELAAQAIHRAGKRAAKPFIAIDCLSLSETRFESELFGHEREVYSKTASAKKGLVDAADGGTLFLDEVSDVPLTMQPKLLRLLETGTYRRPGSTAPRHVDVRFISSTSRDLYKMVQKGLFRTDLYHRLNTLPIHVPSLRERLEDIPALVAHLLEKIAPGKKRTLTNEALYRLQTYSFPGNIRELRNFLERGVLLCETGEIDTTHLLLPPVETGETASPAVPFPTGAQLKPFLAAFRGSRKSLAEMLGVSERTLYRRLAELQEK